MGYIHVSYSYSVLNISVTTSNIYKLIVVTNLECGDSSHEKNTLFFSEAVHFSRKMYVKH